MQTRTLAIGALLAGASAAAIPLAPLFRKPAGPQGALGSYLTGSGQPDVYVELFDLGQLERDLRASGLGRLGRLFLPVLDEHLDADVLDEMEEHLGLDPAALIRGELSWEDALAKGLFNLGHEHLGLERAEALHAVAALGTRFSVALDAEREQVAFSWSLRSGGQAVMAELMGARVEQLSRGALGARLLHDGREQGGGQLFGLTIDGDEEAFVVVRPDLVAFSTDSVWGTALATATTEAAEATPADGSGFAAARQTALRGGAPLWAWIDGTLMGALAESEDEREALALLGLDRVRAVELALGGDGGQLTSRLRVELTDGERGGLFDLLRGGQASWSGLEHLTGDSFLVAGLGRAPADVGSELVELAAHLSGSSEVRDVWGRMSSAPLLSELLTPGATGDESLFFLRSGPIGLPMGYLAMPATDELLERLHGLRDGQRAFGGEMNLRVKEIDGTPCWLLAKGNDGLALVHRDGAVIASQSFLALQDYMRRREREDAEERAELIAEVREALRRSREASGLPAASLAGFAHVRTQPLCETAWPWVMMGLTMSGAEGLEDLPDAFEIAEEIGDTTLLLFDDGDAVELRGRGLFGGLGVLF